MVADSGKITALVYVGALMGPEDGKIQLSQSCLATLWNINKGKTKIVHMNYQIYL